jgi:hypothetical protein
MGRVRLFFESMFSELGSGLTGVASIPFTVAALWVSNHVQRVLYGSLAGGLLLFSAYRIWLKEHLELEEEKAKNQKPDLHGEILETLIGICTPASEPPLCASVVLLSVKAWNAIQIKFLRLQIRARSDSQQSRRAAYIHRHSRRVVSQCQR